MSFNDQVIDEFRANNGAVGGAFAGRPLLLLHHEGARTGTVRVTPLVYAVDGRRYVVAASKGGHDFHPHWFLNVKANPHVTVELGSEVFPAKAAILESGPERDALYAKLGEILTNFVAYEEKTERTIPVVALERSA